MSEQILTIDLNEEYRIKIENPTQFSSSFFKDVYERAAKATADIIEQTNEIKKKEGEFLKEKQEYNNIIAFTGDRGTGKTSAMISFAQYLIKHNGVGFETEDLRINNLKQNKFISIPTIDPSLFENDENIMEVMLAQMFSQFEEKIKEKDTSIDLDKKRKILELFEKVYENLQTIKNGTKKYDGEAIETLSKLACSTKLRENIKKLVLEYITLLCNNTSDSNKSDSNFLIVPIDDFDLNVKGAVEMSEQIRKYFMIPNVIILMSVNMTQLKDAKELSIRKEFKEVLSTMEEDPSKMAIQYLLKLIPDNRRIYMPNIDVNINSLKISIKDKERNIKIYKSIDSCVLGEIYRKTGLIFLSDAYKSHILISYNLRKLIELIVLVYGKMINTDNNNYKSINYNLFDNFFINNIINDYSDIKTKKLFFKIKNTRPEKRNYYAIQFLISELKTIHIKHNPEDFKIKNNAYFLTPRHQDSNASYIPRNSHDQEFCDLIDKLNHYSNISLGDLFFILEYYGDFVNNKHSLWLLKSLEVLYSLEIYKYLFIIKKPEVVQNIIGESFLPSPNLKRIIRQKENIHERYILDIDLEYKFNNGTTINSQLKDIVNNDKIELFSYFITYFGSEYSMRRKLETPIYRINGVVNNMTNYKSATINILSPFILELTPENNISRFTNYFNINTNTTEFKTTPLTERLTVWNESSLGSIPIYSMDLINKAFDGFIDVKSSRSKELYQDICYIYNEIYKRIKRITTETDYLQNEYDNIVKQSNIIDEFQKGAFIELFQSIKYFSLLDKDEKLSKIKDDLKNGYYKCKRLIEFSDYIRSHQDFNDLNTSLLLSFIDSRKTSYTTTISIKNKIETLINNLTFREDKVSILPLTNIEDETLLSDDNSNDQQQENVTIQETSKDLKLYEPRLEPSLLTELDVEQTTETNDNVDEI